MVEKIEEIVVRPEVVAFIQIGILKNKEKMIGGSHKISGADIIDHIEKYSRGEDTPLGKRFYEAAKQLYEQSEKK